MKSIFAGLFLILLAGCATNSNRTQAGQIADQNRKILADATVAGDACSDTLKQTEAAKIVISQILFVNQTSPNKFELMSSKAKINQAQKEALKTFLTQASTCRQPGISASSRIDAAYVGVINRYYSKMDTIYLALLDDKFTIGDANRAKDKAIQERATEFATADAQYIQKLQAMDNDEYAQRQRTAAILLPYMMQQNAINSQNQQNLYNQQMQNIRVNTPVYIQPVTTTCQAVGNQVICNSR